MSQKSTHSASGSQTLIPGSRFTGLLAPQIAFSPLVKND